MKIHDAVHMLWAGLLAAGLLVATPARAQTPAQPTPDGDPSPATRVDPTPEARPATPPPRATPPAERPPNDPPPRAKAPADAKTLKRTTGLFLQGQVAFNVTAYGGYYYFGSYNVLPLIRLGYQARSWSLSAELNFSSLSVDGDGTHLFSVGPIFQPTVWRSARNRVQLALVLGAGVGTVAVDGGDNIILGDLDVGVATHYFPNRHFGVGVETGLRIQFVQTGSGSKDLVTAALLYVALSVEAIIGK